MARLFLHSFFVLPWALLGCMPADAPTQSEHTVERESEERVSAPMQVGTMRVIEGDGSSDDLEFHRIRSVRILDQDLIVVADGGGNRIVLVRLSDASVRTFGRSGGGPEEFSFLQHVVNLGDSAVLAFDPLRQRSVLVDTTPALIADFPMVELPPGSSMAGLLEDSILVVILVPSSPPPPAGSTRIDSALLVLVRPGGTMSRVAPMYWHTMGSYTTVDGTILFPVPFSPRGKATAADETIYVSDGAGAIVRLSHDGRYIGQISWPAPRQRLSRDMIDHWISDLESRRPAADHRAMRRFFESLEYPDSLPATDAILSDDEGYLWTQRFHAPGADSTEWFIFSPDDEWLGVLRLSARFRPTHITRNAIAGVHMDEYDIERPAILPLIRDH